MIQINPTLLKTYLNAGNLALISLSHNSKLSLPALHPFLVQHMASSIPQKPSDEPTWLVVIPFDIPVPPTNPSHFKLKKFISLIRERCEPLELPLSRLYLSNCLTSMIEQHYPHMSAGVKREMLAKVSESSHQRARAFALTVLVQLNYKHVYDACRDHNTALVRQSLFPSMTTKWFLWTLNLSHSLHCRLETERGSRK